MEETSKELKNRRGMLGSIILGITALIWGTAFVFQRVGMESITPITFSAARMTISAVAVGILSLFIKEKKEYPEEQKKKRAKSVLLGGVVCGLFLNTASLFQQMGIVYTSAGKAGFITAMYILIVPVVSFVFFKKKYPWFVWVAVLLGVAGMYMLCITEGFSISKGDSLVLICAVLFSGHILSCNHFAGRANPVRISAVQFLTASLVSWVIAFIVENPNLSDIKTAIVPIVYCGLMSGGLGYTLQLIGQKYTEPTVASLIMSFEAVFAVLTGALVLGEKLSTREIIGCVIMFAAIIVVQIPKEKDNESSQES